MSVLMVTWPVGCVFNLLYEVNHASLSVSHFPVKGQWLQAVIPGKWAPRAKVHGAAGLSVAGHRFPPVCPLFVLWKEGSGKPQKGGKMRGKQSRQSERLACRNTSALLFFCLLQGTEGGPMSIMGFACEWWGVCLPKGCFAFACAHTVNFSAYVYVYVPCGLQW